MTEKTETKSRPLLARQAALASVVAPVFAIILTVMTFTATHDSPNGKLAVGIVGSAFLVAGLVCAVIGLLSIRKHGKKGILGRSIAGLVINSLIISSAFLSFQRLQRVQEQRMQPRFSFIMPSTYAVFPAGMQQPDVLHCIIKGDPTDDTLGIVCFIEKLDGTISKDDDMSVFVASRPDVTMFQGDWKGHRIDVFRVQESLEGIQVLTFIAQIPLRPVAIQVKIVGLMDRENEIMQDLRNVLAGIDGASNW